MSNFETLRKRFELSKNNNNFTSNNNNQQIQSIPPPIPQLNNKKFLPTPPPKPINSLPQLPLRPITLIPIPPPKPIKNECSQSLPTLPPRPSRIAPPIPSKQPFKQIPPPILQIPIQSQTPHSNTHQQKKTTINSINFFNQNTNTNNNNNFMNVSDNQLSNNLSEKKIIIPNKKVVNELWCHDESQVDERKKLNNLSEEIYYDDDDDFSSDDYDDDDDGDDDGNRRYSFRDWSENLKIISENNRVSFAQSITSTQSGSSSSIIGKTPNIFEELITTEEDYIRSLKYCIDNYVRLLDYVELPDGLDDDKYFIFGTIEEIYNFHSNEFLPKLQECNDDIEGICNVIREMIKMDRFYLYIQYAINKPKSVTKSNEYEKFFKDRQIKIGDKLGLNSLLITPIQRLFKYSNLLGTSIDELGKFYTKCTDYKRKLELCSRTEKDIQRLLDTVNEAITLSNIEQFNIDINEQGKFLKGADFKFSDTKFKLKKYCGRLYIFELLIILVEYNSNLIDKKTMNIRRIFKRNEIGIRTKRNRFFLYNSKVDEVQFSGRQTEEIIRLITEILEKYRDEEKVKINSTYKIDGKYLGNQSFSYGNIPQRVENSWDHSCETNKIVCDNNNNQASNNQIVTKNESEFLTDNNIDVDDNDEEYHDYYNFSDSSDCDQIEGQSNNVTISETINNVFAGSTINIVDELITTEMDYIRILKNGIENYVKIMDYEKLLPESLRGQKYCIFGTIEEIYNFHSNEFLPKLQEYNDDIGMICRVFHDMFEYDYFYPYVQYAMNKPLSVIKAKENEKFFQERQNLIGDKLGLNSFLIQPIQRLIKYRVLLSTVIMDLGKNFQKSPEYTEKLAVCCYAEKDIQKLLNLTNEIITINQIEYEREIFKINFSQQGKFLKGADLKFSDTKFKFKKYNGRLFIFEELILLTEYNSFDKKKLNIRRIFKRNELGLRTKENCFYLYTTKMDQIKFYGQQTDEIILIIRGILVKYANEEKEKINQNFKKSFNNNNNTKSIIPTINDRASEMNRTWSEVQDEILEHLHQKSNQVNYHS